MKSTAWFCVVCLLGACSDSIADPPTPVTSSTSSTNQVVASGSAGTDAATEVTSDVAPASSSENPPNVDPTLPAVDSIVPETGVPGLDSPDRFCASWSQWAGSYQVISVTSAFGGGTESDLAALEVVASTVVIEANSNLLAAWPAEIEAERNVGEDKLFGPLTRRLSIAREALESAGADETMLATIRTAWLDGLAARDPANPEFSVDLPEEIWAVVDIAGEEFLNRLVPFGNDPSLIIEADTRPIDDYIASTCPDQGTLLGAEVSG